MTILEESAPHGGAISLERTRELMTPVEGPRDPLPTDIEVAVIGAGPIGMTAASLLGSYGIRTALIDQKLSTTDLPRAIGIDDFYMRLLHQIGLGEVTLGHSAKPFGIHFLSPMGFALLKAQGFITPNGFGNRNSASQPVFEKILLAGLARQPTVSVTFGAGVTAVSQDKDGVTVSVLTSDAQEHKFRAKFLLGCDGAKSLVRSKIGARFAGVRIEHPQLVIDLAEFPDQSNHSRFFCNPVRPLNSVPVPYGGRRLEFMVLSDDDRDWIQSDEGIRYLVDNHSPYRGVELKVIRRAIYGYSGCVAEPLQSGRAFLLGDAAHIMPPFGGQGMNSGARDAGNLSWKLASVLRGTMTPEALGSYEIERRDDVQAMVDYSVRIGRIANTQSRPLAFLRDLGFAAMNTLPSVRRYFAEMRYMPRPFYKDGLVIDANRRSNSPVGRIAPRFQLQDDTGAATSLDEVAGSSFALVGINLTRQELEEAAKHRLWESLKPQLVSIGNSASSQTHFTLNGDIGRGMFDENDRHIIVVRPDRYVAGRGTPQQFADLSDRLDALIGGSNHAGARDGSRPTVS